MFVLHLFCIQFTLHVSFFLAFACVLFFLCRMTVATPMSPVMSTPIRGGNAPKFVSPSNAIQLWSEQSREISNR